MKKLVAVAALLFIVLACAQPVEAGCAVVRKAVVVQQHAYVAPYYAAPLTYGYTGYYNAGYDAQQALIKDQAAFIKLQTEAYQQLRQALTSPGVLQPAAEAVSDFAAFAKQRCIQCHQDGTDKATETGFVMFEKDGTLSPFSIPEKRRMAALIEQGQMPPGSTVSQQQRQAVKQLLTKR